MKQPEFGAQDAHLLQLLANGKSVKAIMAEMNWTFSKAKARLGRIYRELNVHNGTAAAVWYVQNMAHVSAHMSDAAHSYRHALESGDFVTATRKWEATGIQDRPADAAIHVSLMYVLQDKPTYATETSALLPANEMIMVFMFQQWLAGEEYVLPLLLKQLASLPPGSRARHAGYMALYRYSRTRNLDKLAALAAEVLIVELV